MKPSKAANRLSAARSKLLQSHPFFAIGGLRLALQEDATLDHDMHTDGTHLAYNPDRVEKLSNEEVVFEIAHEVGHCILLHPYRQGSRDNGEWNIAADYAVNQLLVSSGLTPPAGCLLDQAYVGLSAEQIYAIRHQEKQENPDQPEPQPQPTSFGPPNDPGTEASDQDDKSGPSNGQPQPAPGAGQTEPMTEAQWQVVAEQAAMVSKKQAGDLPGDLARAIAGTMDGTIDWRTALSRFVEQTLISYWTWSRPNRRYFPDAYLPSVVRENTAPIVVAFDTSGSFSPSDLEASGAELNDLRLTARPSKITVLSCDTEIRSEQVFSPDDDEMILDLQGGGGTRFAPVLDWITDQDDQPACLIYFTDLEGSIPAEPEYPVLWITPEHVTRTAPYGETVRMARTY